MKREAMEAQDVSASYAPQVEMPAVPEGYKQTEVGVIPEDWSVVPLDSVSRVTSGKRLPVGHYVTEKETPYPYIRVSDMCQGGVITNDIKYVPQEAFQPIRQYRIYKEDLFISVAGTLGLVGVIPESLDGANLTENANRISQIACDRYYLLYVLLSDHVQGVIESIRTVGAQPKLALTRIRNFQIPLPPTEEEQRAIATALSDVDALLEELDRLIAKKRDIKQATMQQLLTAQTRLPGFEGEWAEKRLGDVVRLNRLSVIPAANPDEHFVHFSLPAFDDGKVPQIELGSAIGSNKFLVPPGAILVSKLNPRIPRVWVPEAIPINACGSTEWLVLTPTEDTDRLFLFTLCSSPDFCKKMEAAATGTTGSHQRISPNVALDINVKLPTDLDEQVAIAAVLSDMDAEIEALEQRRTKTASLKQSMMQALLTGRIRLV